MTGVGWFAPGRACTEASSEVGVDPQLGQLIDDEHDRRQRPRRPASAGASIALNRGRRTPGRAGATATSPPVTGRWAVGSRVSRRRDAVDAVGEGVVGEASEVRARSVPAGRRRPSSHSSIVSSSSRPACLRRSWIARSARARRLRRAARRRCSFDRRRPGPRHGRRRCPAAAWPGSRPRRRASSTPARRTPPPGRYSTSLARAAAMHGRVWPPRRLPILGSSGLTRRSTSSDSSPMTHDLLDVDLLGQQLEQRPPRRSGRRRPAATGQRQPQLRSGWRRRMPAWPRSVRPSSTARRTVRHRAPRAPRRGSAPTSWRRPARQVDDCPAPRRRSHRSGAGTSSSARKGRIGASHAAVPTQRQRGAWRRRRLDRPSSALRDSRRADAPQVPGRQVVDVLADERERGAARVEVGQVARRRRAASAAVRDRIQRSSVGHRAG